MKNLMLIVPMLHQGGFERVCVATARLMQKYYNVSILIFSDKDINYDVTGINVVNINVPARKGKFNKAINLLKRIQKVRAMKRAMNIDIAYSFGSSANYVNVLSKGKETVYTGIRCETDMDNPREVRLFTKKADKVLSCSREIMRELRRDYQYEKSEFIYNPLDTKAIAQKANEQITDFPFDHPEDLQIIAASARNDRIKGLWHLVKAFSIVASSHPNARLMVLGAGDFSKLEQMAEAAGVANMVAFPGVKKNPFPYLAQAELYVLSSNREGFPNALLEAMALGKPVIAADCKTGPREILLDDAQYEALVSVSPRGESTTATIDGQYGILMHDMSDEPDYNIHNITEDDQDLAVEIIKLLDNSERMAGYAQKAYERALVYTPENYRERLHEVLEML